MPQLLEIDDRGLTVGGVIGVHADYQIRLDGESLHEIVAGWLHHHPCERPGSGGFMAYPFSITRFDFFGKFPEVNSMPTDFPVTYPPQFPLSCITTGFEIVRGGQLRERLPEFALAFWNVQGHVQRVTFGDPVGSAEDVELAASADEAASIEEFAACCETAVAELETEGFAAAGDKAINPATLLVVLKLFLELVNIWRNRS